MSYASTRVPSDIVKAIFHFIGKERFPADVPKIHTFFYDLSQKRGFRILMSDFVFDPSRQFPYSTTVSFALDRLQKSKLLQCINPGLDQFEISEKLANQKEVESLFDDSEQIKLKTSAELFLKVLR